MLKRRLLFACYSFFSILVLLPLISSAKNKHLCPPSSCGNVTNISYPFRLKGDPIDCGDPNYELGCEDNRTVLFLNSTKSYVQSINHSDSTIQLTFVLGQNDLCSLFPINSFTLGLANITYSYGLYVDIYGPYTRSETGAVVFMKCTNRVESSLYVEIPLCNNGQVHPNSSSHGKQYSYAMVGHMMVFNVQDSCSVDSVVLTSYPGKGKAYLEDIHNALAYGIELSWDPIFCKQCHGAPCYFDKDFNFTGCWYCTGSVDSPSCLWALLVDTAIKVAACLDEWPMFSNEHPGRLGLLVGFAITVAVYIVMYLVGRCLCCSPFAAAFLIYKVRRRHRLDDIENFLESHNNLTPIRYSYFQIWFITKRFKDKLGEGAHGSVYKGRLRSGHDVAVKLLGTPKADGREFINEVATVGRIHHVNVVRLVGYCAQGSKRALVYDFMPNGSLEKYVFGGDEGTDALSCEKMFEIALGVARGVEYLHRGCDMHILHFDIKPHNILLDENFTPKVSDFGLAKLYPTDDSIVTLTAARGTVGYMAPELFYKNIGGVSNKADVYSFGMLLMEMVGRRKNWNEMTDDRSSQNQNYFPLWAYDQISTGREIEILEASERENTLAKQMVAVALWCIQMNPRDRPSMSKVLEMLEGNVADIHVAPKPFLCTEHVTGE